MSAEPRRGSSLFSGPGSGAGNSININSKSNDPKGGDGGTPDPQERPPGGVSRRASSVLQPGALGGIGGLGIDFNDSDYEDSDEEVDDGPGNVNGQGTGGPNHRPYVGGFAAAAYEAARAHHNTSSKEQDEEEPQDQQKPSPSKEQEKS